LKSVNCTTICGKGIGLGFVKTTVENHNGIIIATGELNLGATFDLYFPIGIRSFTFFKRNQKKLC